MLILKSPTVRDLDSSVVTIDRTACVSEYHLRRFRSATIDEIRDSISLVVATESGDYYCPISKISKTTDGQVDITGSVFINKTVYIHSVLVLWDYLILKTFEVESKKNSGRQFLFKEKISA